MLLTFRLLLCMCVFPSAITHWNDLPFDTADLSSPAMFKRLIMQL